MNRTSKRLRVVVCGATFGRTHLQGVAELPDELELVGLLARGSDNARACATRYGVPLYTSVSELPRDGVDVACVVVRSTMIGGAGTELALELLRRKIHVLQEYPVHQEELAACLKESRIAGCLYWVNSFYPDTDSVSRFIETSRRLRNGSEALFVDAACSIHVLYPMVDILGQALGGFRPWSFYRSEPHAQDEPLTSVHGRIAGTPLFLRVQNRWDPSDQDNSTYLLHRVALCTNEGTLLLADTHGPVLWLPRMHGRRREDGVLDLHGSNPSSELHTFEAITPLGGSTYRSVYADTWTHAIQRTLLRFKSVIAGRKRDEAASQYQMTACRIWHDLSHSLGPTQAVTFRAPVPLALADITERPSSQRTGTTS